MPQAVAGYQRFGIMTQPESVLAMHKSYYCLYHMRDFKKAMAVAVDYFKSCDDVDLIFVVLMDIINRYMTMCPSTSLEEVKKTCRELLESKNLIGLHKIILSRNYLDICARGGQLRRSARSYRKPKFTNVGGAISLVQLSRFSRVNLSIQRIPRIRKLVNQISGVIKRNKNAMEPRATENMEGLAGRAPKAGQRRDVLKEFERNLVGCYQDENMVYYRPDCFPPLLEQGDNTEACEHGSMCSSSSFSSSCTLSPSETVSGDSDSEIRFERHFDAVNALPLQLDRTYTEDSVLRCRNSDLMQWWRKHLRLVKTKMFQVCNMLFINVNVPFMAVNLLSCLFQNMLVNTTEGIRRSMAYIFNHEGYPTIMQEDANGNKYFTEDDATVLYMVAANCLEIALNCHNARVRFDTFSLFYFLVFIDSIFIKFDISETIGSLVPVLPSILDPGLIKEQRINDGANYLRCSLKYHHDLFRRKLQHFSAELKKHRVLSIANYRLMNCLEQFLLISHGIFGFNLTLRIAPAIIGGVRKEASLRSMIGYNQYDSHSGEQVTSCHTPTRNYSHWCPRYQKPYNEHNLSQWNLSGHESSKQRKVALVSDIDTGSQTHLDSGDPIHVASVIKALNSASSQVKEVNSFVTEATEISVLLLQMLICSDYVEILSGNTLFTDPGGNMEPTTLMSAMALRFVLDLFIAVTDATITKLVEIAMSTEAVDIDDGDIQQYLERFKQYFGRYHRTVEESNCCFYFILLELDWIFHKEGIYSDVDYAIHQRLLSKVIDHDLPTNRNELGALFEVHYRLYEKIAVLMGSGEHVKRSTAECVDAFKSRTKSWNIFDEITIRNTPPEDEISINREILAIYYSDVAPIKGSFNPYKSVFTPKYFPVVKELIYRAKAAMVLYYIKPQQK